MATAKAKTVDHDGFWGRDEDFGILMHEKFREGEPFLLLNVERDTPFTNPNTGEVIDSRSKLTVRRLDGYTFDIAAGLEGLPFEVKTLAQPIYDRAGAVKDGDFPCVVSYRKVKVKGYNSEATILDKIFAWPIPDDIRTLAAGEVAKAIGDGN